jgi:hypothetical protein
MKVFVFPLSLLPKIDMRDWTASDYHRAKVWIGNIVTG